MGISTGISTGIWMLIADDYDAGKKRSQRGEVPITRPENLRTGHRDR
jgi:hypothetical protein